MPLSRRTRLALLALLGPAALTIVSFIMILALLTFVGINYTRAQVEAGVFVFFVCWQTIALSWLVKNWGNGSK